MKEFQKETRERDLINTALVIYWPALGQARTWSSELGQVSHPGRRDPNTWTSFCCIYETTIRGWGQVRETGHEIYTHTKTGIMWLPSFASLWFLSLNDSRSILNSSSESGGLFWVFVEFFGLVSMTSSWFGVGWVFCPDLWDALLDNSLMPLLFLDVSTNYYKHLS